jgi:AbiV family abortive infection protein
MNYPSGKSLICEDCNREKAPQNYLLPEDVTKEKKYCACIPWETMKKCAELSLLNAESLADDAEFLLKHKRVSSSVLLTVFALEEVGKAHIGLEYFINKKNVTANGRHGDFHNRFLNHKAKISEALKLGQTQQQLEKSKAVHRRALEEVLYDKKLDIAYVDFNARFQTWQMPMTTNPNSIATPYSPICNTKEAKQLIKASGEIKSVIIADYIRIARTAITYVRSELSSIPETP